MRKSYLLTDIGSTTTKALLLRERGGEYRLEATFGAPTTVEQPYEDVTIGVLEALEGLGRKVGVVFVSDGKLVKKNPEEERFYCTSSSAGGGLQVLVCGVMQKVTADSARRAALGAGAVIVDVIAVDDGRPSFIKIEAIRNLRPDMILVAGGFDGGNVNFVLEVSDLLNAADLRPRFGGHFRIPVIYAGNKDGRDLVVDTLKRSFDVIVVDNLRPSMDVEVLGPARTAMHELFMSHVMAHAPGYRKLLQWVDADVLPTPLAVGKILEAVARRNSVNILACDIGGATTDIFSVIGGEFARSVAANIGMSYSSANVLVEAGVDNVARWLPFEAPPELISNLVGQKLIYPTTIPETFFELAVEQALAREALRIALGQHKEIAVALAATSSVIDRFIQVSGPPGGYGQKTIDMMKIGMLIGSGGVLSNAPRRAQAALMMLDAFQPEGVTELFVDSVFMMPHLGVLLALDAEAAMNVLYKDCLIHLGPCICPHGQVEPGKLAVRLEVTQSGREPRVYEVMGGDIAVIKGYEGIAGQEIRVKAVPAGGLDLGAGESRSIELNTSGGVLGIIVDARGRPLSLPDQPRARVEMNARWAESIGAYSEAEIASMRQELLVQQVANVRRPEGL